MSADVAPNAEEILFAAADSAMDRLLRTVTAEPHRLSVDALQERLTALQGQPADEIRTGLQAIANELELYRSGFDIGYERGCADGYDSAIEDAIEHPEEFTKRLLEIRPEAER